MGLPTFICISCRTTTEVTDLYRECRTPYPRLVPLVPPSYPSYPPPSYPSYPSYPQPRTPRTPPLVPLVPLVPPREQLRLTKYHHCHVLPCHAMQHDNTSSTAIFLMLPVQICYFCCCATRYTNGGR